MSPASSRASSDRRGTGRDRAARPAFIGASRAGASLRQESRSDSRVACHDRGAPAGVRTSRPMIVADELEADWARVRVVQAVGDEATYGGQNTDGSRSVRHFLSPMREMGAATRQMLETAAARTWDVDVSQVRARNHHVVHAATGRTLGYGQLAAAARDLPVPRPEALTLKRPEEFRYIGKDMPIIDLVEMTSGRAGYGIDVRLPGMKYAVIARPPVYGGRVDSYDEAPASQWPASSAS
ncbi:MAG TPA: molybdopterin cofactor-binding domain-containing protein [Vicinamibacterales bacterium]